VKRRVPLLTAAQSLREKFARDGLIEQTSIRVEQSLHATQVLVLQQSYQRGMGHFRILP
jgi:hypothetical protein